jgi:hypothetical protein
MVSPLSRCNTILSPKIGLISGKGPCVPAEFRAKTWAMALECGAAKIPTAIAQTKMRLVIIMVLAPERQLPAASLKTQIRAEKFHHMILKAIRHCTGVSAMVDLKAVRNSIVVQQVMQLPRIHP